MNIVNKTIVEICFLKLLWNECKNIFIVFLDTAQKTLYKDNTYIIFPIYQNLCSKSERTI